MRNQVRLEDYLNNMGAHAFDVIYYDKNNQKLSEEDLKSIDFDNVLVIDTKVEKDMIHSIAANKELNIHHVTLDYEI
ncbi:MAG: hypothetical protein ACNA7U_07795 [Candidatus Izemoplasmataceae bacterium]